MATPSQTTVTSPDGFMAALPRSILPIAAMQAERFREIFRHLRIAPNASGGRIEHAEAHILRPPGCEGLLVFPRPSALGGAFADAVLRLWHVCLAEYQVAGTPNQSADPPDPRRFPESCRDFHRFGLAVAYGDFCVIPVQLGSAHRTQSPLQAYQTLTDEQRPLFAYEVLAALIGIPKIAELIRDGHASLRFVERIRSSLNPVDHLLNRRGRSNVPEFAVLSGDGMRIRLSGEPSPNRVPGEGGGIGLATRFPVKPAHPAR